MIIRGTEDLRVQKTVAAIDQAFTAMQLESDYEDMSVKELCARAKINKKTFYRYYPTLQDLFKEKLERLSTGYLERIAHYRLPEEFRHINREFFVFANEQGTVYEKIVCHPSYASFAAPWCTALCARRGKSRLFSQASTGTDKTSCFVSSTTQASPCTSNGSEMGAHFPWKRLST